MSDSHLLLSWAVATARHWSNKLRRESRAAVLPPPLVLLDNEIDAYIANTPPSELQYVRCTLYFVIPLARSFASDEVHESLFIEQCWMHDTVFSI